MSQFRFKSLPILGFLALILSDAWADRLPSPVHLELNGEVYAVEERTTLGKSVYMGTNSRGENAVFKFWDLTQPRAVLRAQNEIAMIREIGESPYISSGRVESEGFKQDHAYLVIKKFPGETLYFLDSPRENRAAKKKKWLSRVHQIGVVLMQDLISNWHNRYIVHGDIARRQVIVQSEGEEIVGARLIDAEASFLYPVHSGWLGPVSLRGVHGSFDRLPPELKSHFDKEDGLLFRLGSYTRDFWDLGLLLAELIVPVSETEAQKVNKALKATQRNHPSVHALLTALSHPDPHRRYHQTWDWIESELTGLRRNLYGYAPSDRMRHWSEPELESVSGTSLKLVRRPPFELDMEGAIKVVGNGSHPPVTLIGTKKKDRYGYYVVRFYPAGSDENAITTPFMMRLS